MKMTLEEERSDAGKKGGAAAKGAPHLLEVAAGSDTRVADLERTVVGPVRADGGTRYAGVL